MKILIVDDEQANRLILQAMLNKGGYEIVQASNGVEAIEIFEKEHPDLVLMDVMMPVMDGYEATRLIKEKSVSNFVPVIFLTAITDESALVECVAVGGDDFLTKPYNRTILQAKISAMERIRQLNRTVVAQNDELAEYNKYVEREQEVAEEIFTKLMEQGQMDLPMITAHRESAATFNGDIFLVSQQPSGMIYLLVGDFTGHGLAAALGALPAAQIFYAMCNKGFGIAEIISEINQRLKETLPVGMFLASVLVQLNPKTSIASIWNGGLPDVLIKKKSTQEILHYPSKHMALGIVPRNKLVFNLERVHVEKGDRLLIYSDGIIEGINKKEEFFGQERLEAILDDTQPGEGAIVPKIVSEFNKFLDGEEPHDDVTIVEFDFDEDFFENKIQKCQVVSAYGPRNWETSFLFNHDTLSVKDPLPLIMDVVRNIQGLHEHKENLFLILSELFTNALDYGVLKLDPGLRQEAGSLETYYQARKEKLEKLGAGWVKIAMQNKIDQGKGLLKIIMEDSGEGFDVAAVLSNIREHGSLCGRGIDLVQNLVLSMDYNDSGNRVEILYEWQ